MDTSSNVPEKYYRDDYDPYSEAALILKDPGALENTLRTLSQYDKLIENKLKTNIEQDHTEVTDFLSNVRDCEVRVYSGTARRPTHSYLRHAH
jgi:hypothetical protein